MNLWSSESRSELEREKSLDEKGEVFPLREIGRPLAASFGKSAARVDKYVAARKATGLGIFVLASEAIPVDGWLGTGNRTAGYMLAKEAILAHRRVAEGSFVIQNGGSEGTRTLGLRRDRPAL